MNARSCCLALAILLIVVGVSSTAHAGPPPFRTTPTPCVRAVAALANGTVYGAGDCAGGVVLSVRTPGGAWRTGPMFWKGTHVEAVAVDETATFIVVSCWFDGTPACSAPAPEGRKFLVGKVPHGGVPTPLTYLGESEASDTATIVARGGKWWAAWVTSRRDYDRPGSGSSSLDFRKTIGGAARGTVPVPADPTAARTFVAWPAMALTTTGAEIAFVSQPDRPGARGELQLATAGSDGAFVTAPYQPAVGADALLPDIAYAGGRTFVAWSREGHPAVAFPTDDGTVRRIDLPRRGRVWSMSVAASGGVLTVTDAETFDYQGGTTTRVYARSLDARGTLVGTTELTAAAGRADPHVYGTVRDSTAVRGRATVVFSDGKRLLTASQ